MRCRQLEMEAPIRCVPLHQAHRTSRKRPTRRRTSRVGYTGRNRLGSDEEDPVCAKVQPLGRCLHAVSSTGDGGSDSLWSIAPSAPNERITAYSTPNFSAWLHRTQRLGSHEEDRPRPGDVACGVVNWRWRDRFGAVHCTQRTERAENRFVDAELLGLATPDATARLRSARLSPAQMNRIPSAPGSRPARSAPRIRRLVRGNARLSASPASRTAKRFDQVSPKTRISRSTRASNRFRWLARACAWRSRTRDQTSKATRQPGCRAPASNARRSRVPIGISSIHRNGAPTCGSRRLMTLS